MSSVSWLKTHRKQVAVHSLIIAGFILFTGLAAEPLFDRLERIPGEAQIHRISLPAEGDGMRSGIDEVSTASPAAVEVGGWAFIPGHDVDVEDTGVYVVLKSGAHTYVFGTSPRERPDVTAFFRDLGLNLDWSGFISIIPTRKVADGEYVLGIYIRKGDIEVLQYTDRTLEF